MSGVKVHDTVGDDWAGIADEYEAITASTSVTSLTACLRAADALWPLHTATGILDAGCGPGAITKRLLRDFGSALPPPAECPIVCSDFSAAMIAAVEKNKAAGGEAWARVRGVVQNCMDLEGCGEGEFSHVLAGFVYFMTPDPRKCMAESRRVLKEGGVCVTSSWAGNQWMEVMLVAGRDRPDFSLPSLPVEWQSVEGVKAQFEAAGFRDVGAEEVAAEMPFESPEGLVDSFLRTMPHVLHMLRGLDEGEVEGVRGKMVEECVRLSEGEGHPGVLRGTSIVGWGRK